MVTVEAVMKSLDKMRKVYQFKDEDTGFCMGGNVMRCDDSIVKISTLDRDTGVFVNLEKDASEEMQKGEQEW